MDLRIRGVGAAALSAVLNHPANIIIYQWHRAMHEVYTQVKQFTSAQMHRCAHVVVL